MVLLYNQIEAVSEVVKVRGEAAIWVELKVTEALLAWHQAPMQLAVWRLTTEIRLHHQRAISCEHLMSSS